MLESPSRYWTSTAFFCTLADENANVYGAAPFAMPVRLLVNEEQADEASRILATMAQPDSDQIEQLKKAEQESFPKNESADILQELKKIRGWTETNTVFVVLLLAGLVFYFLIQLSSPASTRSPRSAWPASPRSTSRPRSPQVNRNRAESSEPGVSVPRPEMSRVASPSSRRADRRKG